MFTGIIEATGQVEKWETPGASNRLHIRSRLHTADIPVGGSVAVNGVCLTLVENGPDGFIADVMPETWHRTNLGGLQPGEKVNLERPTPATGRLDGHIVQGHVDGTGRIIDRISDDHAELLWITVPDELAHYVADKGSIAVDGISLTVVQVVDGSPPRFCVALIPTTLSDTTFGDHGVDTVVNLEVDVIAKYVDRILTARPGIQAVAS